MNESLRRGTGTAGHALGKSYLQTAVCVVKKHLVRNDLLLQRTQGVAASDGSYSAVHTAATWPRLSRRFNTSRVSSAVNVWHEAANTTEAVAAPQYMNPSPQQATPSAKRACEMNTLPECQALPKADTKAAILTYAM